MLLACGSPTPQPTRPVPIPEDAIEVRANARDLSVAGSVVGSIAELLADPVEGLHPPLVAALSALGGDPDPARVWIHVGEETPWLMTRKLVNSAKRAGVEVWLGTDTRAWPPPRPHRSRWAPADCEARSAAVVGVDRALTLEIHRDADGMWMLASVRFRPVVQRGSARVAEDDLPPACWEGASCALLEGAAREACRTAVGDAPSRVEVAGEVGCLLPLAKAPDQAAAWARPLGAWLGDWGFTGDHDVMLIPEAKVPFSALAAVFDAFGQLGQPPPSLSLPLIEGNEGAPICDVAIRDRAALDRAEGAWLGTRLDTSAD